MTEKMFRQKALAKLRSPDQLNDLMTVTSPRSWLMLAALVLLVAAAAVWATVASIQTTVGGQGILVASAADPAALEAVLYVSLADGERLRPGMTVKLSPASFRREEYGLLWGRVRSVAGVPSNQGEMTAVLGNDALAQALAAAGALVEVRAELIPDPATPSGYQWTSAEGPPARVQGGTLCTATIVTNEQRPIEMVFAR